MAMAKVPQPRQECNVVGGQTHRQTGTSPSKYSQWTRAVPLVVLLLPGGYLCPRLGQILQEEELSGDHHGRR